MIQADVVKILRRPPHAVDPPRVALFPHHIPAVEWIAPALAVFAEKIRRHARNHFRVKFGVQTKELGMSPDIGAIKIHEDRNVARDANAFSCAIRSQRLPLFEEKKLHRAPHIELFKHLPVCVLHRDRFAMHEFAGPTVPAPELETRAESIKQHKVVYPPRIFMAEALISRANVPGGATHKVASRRK